MRSLVYRALAHDRYSETTLLDCFLELQKIETGKRNRTLKTNVIQLKIVTNIST